MLNIYIVPEINYWLFNVVKDFTLGNSLFEAVKLTKNADFDKYKYSGQGIEFNARGSLSLSNGSGFDKNVVIFGADMSLSVDIDKKKKDILIFGKGPTDVLGDSALTAKKEYAINFTEQQRKFNLSPNYNGSEQLCIC